MGDSGTVVAFTLWRAFQARGLLDRETWLHEVLPVRSAPEGIPAAIAAQVVRALALPCPRERVAPRAIHLPGLPTSAVPPTVTCATIEGELAYHVREAPVTRDALYGLDTPAPVVDEFASLGLPSIAPANAPTHPHL